MNKINKNGKRQDGILEYKVLERIIIIINHAFTPLDI